MDKLTRIATKELVSFLSSRLPELAENSWETHVISCLTFQQQRFAREHNIRKLDQLDFAALLRILHQNWGELSIHFDLDRDGRLLVKELQTVRNRWAHASATTFPAEDFYRDLDTMSRVMNLIGASTNAIDTISGAKQEALSTLSDSVSDSTSKSDGIEPNDTTTGPASQPEQTRPKHRFEIGQIVTLVSDPDTKMPITSIIPDPSETRYTVFYNNGKATFYESQLQPVVEIEVAPTLSADGLRAYLTSVHLLSPSASNLYSLRFGRVQFVPYQYRPVMRLIRADRPRLLIADEVGVGKTIEAGLIIKELKARSNIASVLIICPKALISERKWFWEMKRFDEHFEELDSNSLRHCLRETELEGAWPSRFAQSIVPFSLFNSELLTGNSKGRSRNDTGLISLDPPPKFDLVIVDEAHTICNPTTFSHQAVRYFCDNAQAVVFLTATPLQLGSGDLFSLLNILRPDLVIDRPSFEQMAEPNQFINQAVNACRTGALQWQGKAQSSLAEASETQWGQQFMRESPEFQRIYDSLGEKEIDVEQRVGIVRSLEELYTFSPMINRTRRRDIGEFTTRQPETLEVEFTPAQRRLHDELLVIVRRILEREHTNLNVKFMMTTIRRRAASCINGLVPFLQDLLAGRIEESDDEDCLSVDSVDSLHIRKAIEVVLAQANELDDFDPKVEAFLKVLLDKTKMENNKALVFSTFRHTLSYLAKKLTATDLRYGLVHGQIPEYERTDLRRRFALPKDNVDAIDILLSSEVGSEGLDFQFCDFLVNYDLPWNPMRIEQRIGRIDRFGQQSNSVAIVNMVTPGTIDADIYQRCLTRIGVFNHAIGGSEEILGQITSEIKDIADNFTLSPEQQAEQFQQVSDNQIRRLQEETQLEQQQAELFGLSIPVNTWRKEIDDAETFWLTPNSLKKCVDAYLASITEIDGTYWLGESPLKRLRLNQATRDRLLRDQSTPSNQTDSVSLKWERWLKGNNPLLKVTFDQQIAADDPDSTYLNILHPLVRQAARHNLQDQIAHVNLHAVSTDAKAGTFAFCIYKWRKTGVRSDEFTVAVTTDPNLDDSILQLLQVAVDDTTSDKPDDAAIELISARHHSQWRDARANHFAENSELIKHRRQSLGNSHDARCHLLRDQISSVVDEKIQRMRKSELSRAERDYKEQMAKLDQLSQSADIHIELLVQGSIRITGDDKL